MIAARIGSDHFLVWRLTLTHATRLLPPTARPLISDGQAWLLFAIAELEKVRVSGVPVPGRRRVAAWLIPCHTTSGGLGNFFLQAMSTDPLVVLAYRVLGMREVRHAPLQVSPRSICAPGVRATLGATCDVPELAWFALDRCGLIARPSNRPPDRHPSIARLPLVKRSWHWQPRMMTVEAPFAASLGAEPVAAIDCSYDVALWGAPYGFHRCG